MNKFQSHCLFSFLLLFLGREESAKVSVDRHLLDFTGVGVGWGEVREKKRGVGHNVSRFRLPKKGGRNKRLSPLSNDLDLPSTGRPKGVLSEEGFA